MKEIGDLRIEIDSVDDEILSLLEKRAELAKQVGEAKKIKQKQEKFRVSHYDPNRERAILDRLESLAKGHFPVASIRSVFREIISACRSLQSPLKVSFLGPVGTFTHMAAFKEFGLSVDFIEAPSISGVFDSVERGEAAFGVVPIENSTEGGVAGTLDQLLDSAVMISKEISIPIEHCLVRRTKSNSKVQRIYSHPQALAQCQGFLNKNYSQTQLIQVNSTSEAALACREDDSSAAIASEMAAELFGLHIERKSIQDQKINVTRFAVLSKEDSPETGSDKTSVVFSIKEEVGKLHDVLDVFKKNKVNLLRIESRASRNEMWHYVFFVDFEGHKNDSTITKALGEAQKVTEKLRILGSYPRNGL